MFLRYKKNRGGRNSYICAFHVLSDGFTNPKNNNKDALANGKEHDDDIQKSVSHDIHSTSIGAQTRIQGDKTENKDKDLSQDADDVGAEADINNMESIISYTKWMSKLHFSMALLKKKYTYVNHQGLRIQNILTKYTVYKVVKALYGLHQAPRAWYETLATYPLENRFQRGIIGQTLFIKKQQKDILLVQIYVDDIIFGATN
nr:putative ribonuclease H-like domain-containing protein [Tanacetum cinerariifolium]